MRKGLTEVVFILDKSGSMSGLESDTIGGYNSFIEKQKSSDGEVLISTVLFNDTPVVVHDRVDINKIEPMTGEDYSVGGCTALLDAVGGAIHHIGNVHKYAREEDIPEKTIFVITTDGQENSSYKYGYDKIKKMISLEQEKYGWEFLFLGANIDAVGEAARIGIKNDHAVRYYCDGVGTAMNFNCVSNAVINLRDGKRLNSGWKSDIEEYDKRCESRKNKRCK